MAVDFWGYKGTIKGKPRKKVKGTFLTPAHPSIREKTIGLYSKKVYWTHKGGDKVDKSEKPSYGKGYTKGRFGILSKLNAEAELNRKLRQAPIRKRGKEFRESKREFKSAEQNWASTQNRLNQQILHANTKEEKMRLLKQKGEKRKEFEAKKNSFEKKEYDYKQYKTEVALATLRETQREDAELRKSIIDKTKAFVPMGGMKAVIKIKPDKSTVKEEVHKANAYMEKRKNLGGRPVGSYTHSIPGKGPVGVYEWRKWIAEQKRLQRMRAAQLGSESTQPEPTPEEMQQMQEEVYNNPEDAQTVDQLPPENKFTKTLQFQQAMYNREEYARLVNEQPKGFVQQTVRQRQILAQQQREFSKRNNILNAHKHMLTPQENAIDFMNERGEVQNILDTRNNNIMDTSRPDHIDILHTGRPSILQAGQVLNERNILNAERLNFGKVDLTRDEQEN